MRGPRLVLRAGVIALYVLVRSLVWLGGWLALRATLAGVERRRGWFGRCVLELFRDLGATFIKIGQIMSTRPDLFPPHLVRALERLQDQVGPFPTEVHADLHPGNVLVTPDGRLALLDLGLVGELDDAHRRAFARYFAAWASGDGRTMAGLMADMAPARDAIPDREGFTRDVEAFTRRYLGKPLGELQVGAVIFDMMQILRRHRVRMNATFTMVNIAIAVTEGIGKQLDPSLDLLHEALPFFARLGTFAPARASV
jgi:predicted unusual protein kinase regulating ubiquinone biosynthesis (AarF/ABC1/UbiB family)